MNVIPSETFFSRKQYVKKEKQPNLYMFFGPKGAGKSYLGNRIHNELGVRFLRVEDIWLIEYKKYGFSDKYIEAGLQSSSEKVIEILMTGENLIIEADINFGSHLRI